MTKSIDENLIEEIIQYLDQPPTGPSANIWISIRFAERVLGDIGTQKNAIRHELDHFESPAYQGRPLSEDELREIGLALRIRARAVEGLPELSAQEISDWRFEAPRFWNPPREPYEPSRKIKSIDLNSEQIYKVVDYVRSQHPDVITYWKELRRYMSYVPDDSQWPSGDYVHNRIDEAIKIVVDVSSDQRVGSPDLYDIADML